MIVTASWIAALLALTAPTCATIDVLPMDPPTLTVAPIRLPGDRPGEYRLVELRSVQEATAIVDGQPHRVTVMAARQATARGTISEETGRIVTVDGMRVFTLPGWAAAAPKRPFWCTIPPGS